MTETENLLAFLDRCPSMFHAVSAMKEICLEHGAIPLLESQDWNLQPGKTYCLTRNDSAIIAFRLPETSPRGFMIGASHTDSPSLMVKPDPEIVSEGLVRINVEGYGGLLRAPWFDRPLTLAGRLTCRTAGGIASRLICVDRNLLVIPSLAIHMDRKVNEGRAIPIQKDMLPVYREKDSGVPFMKLLADEAGVKEEDILAYDLFVAPRDRAAFFGSRNEFIIAPHLDDLECCWADLMGFFASKQSDSIAVFAAFDNEEVGSLTKQGADGTMLEDVLERISEALGLTPAERRRMAASSMMVSADNAHAVHPAFPDKADPKNRPRLNGGVVIKRAANQAYTTDAVSSSLFRRFAEMAGARTQDFTNHSDTPGGSTLGRLAISHVSLISVDIGLPQLAMHSPNETAGAKDAADLVNIMKVFYSASLEMGNDGTITIH